MQNIDRLVRRILWMLVNPDTGRVKVERINWKQLEPQRGNYCFEKLQEAIIEKGNEGRFFFLHIIPETPAWSEDVKGDFSKLLMALSDFCKKYPWIYSIDVTIPEAVTEEVDCKEIVDIYLKAFQGIYKMVALEFSQATEKLYESQEVGIILNSDKDTEWIGRQLGERKLQKVWEHAPIRMEGQTLSTDMLSNAVRWHVSALATEEMGEDIDIASLGFRPEIRHCYTLSKIERGKMLPVKAWVVNSGNAPSYLDACFKIRLARVDGDEERIRDTVLEARACYPGEDMILETQIPTDDLSKAQYELHIGLFDRKTGYPISMGIEGRISDGFYATCLSVDIY